MTLLPSAPSPFGGQITIDITGWTPGQVTHLLETVQSIQNRSTPPILADTIEDEGADDAVALWTEEAYIEAINRLLKSNHSAQVASIFECVKNGEGSVSRARVYEVAKWNEKHRTLKGFTRPINRVQQELIDEGLLDEEAPDLLSAVYDTASTGSARAVGFRIPPEVFRLAVRAKAAQDLMKKKIA